MICLLLGTCHALSQEKELPVTRLSIFSKPSDADIILDGKNIGKTPCTLEYVAPGKRTITLRKRGYPEHWLYLTVTQDQYHAIQIFLKKSKDTLIYVGCDTMLAGYGEKLLSDSVIKIDELPSVEKHMKIQYPTICRKAGIEGKVLLQLLVDEKGRVSQIEVVISSGNKYLDITAVYGATDIKFSPAAIDGNNVKVWVMYPVNFTLRQRAE